MSQATALTVDEQFDGSDDEFEEQLTPVVKQETMAELMETLRSPGIPTLTSDEPTRPNRPSVMAR